MNWREILFQAWLGFLDILVLIGKFHLKLLLWLIQYWELPACGVMGVALGYGLAKLIGLPAGNFKNLFIGYMGFLGLVVGARLVTQRVKKNCQKGG